MCNVRKARTTDTRINGISSWLERRASRGDARVIIQLGQHLQNRLSSGYHFSRAIRRSCRKTPSTYEHANRFPWRTMWRSASYSTRYAPRVYFVPWLDTSTITRFYVVRGQHFNDSCSVRMQSRFRSVLGVRSALPHSCAPTWPVPTDI